MLTVAMELSSPETHFLVGVDDDDPALDRYKFWAQHLSNYGRCAFVIQERDTLSGWTNTLARMSGGRYRYLMSMGDDHMPNTINWDRIMADQIADIGGTGITWAYDHLASQDLGTAFMVSYDIVHALRWFMLPALHHYWVDNVWHDLARVTQLGRQANAADIVHIHHQSGLAELDDTYADAEASQLRDHAAYERWKAHRMAEDGHTIWSLVRS